jgi:hypothetical protein
MGKAIRFRKQNQFSLGTEYAFMNQLKSPMVDSRQISWECTRVQLECLKLLDRFEVWRLDF